MNKLKRRVLVSIGSVLTMLIVLWININILPFGNTKLELWTSIVLSGGLTYLFWAPVNKYYQSEF